MLSYLKLANFTGGKTELSFVIHQRYRSLCIDRVFVRNFTWGIGPYVLGMAIQRNFVHADWTKNTNPRKYHPAVISTFTVFIFLFRHIGCGGENISFLLKGQMQGTKVCLWMQCFSAGHKTLKYLHKTYNFSSFDFILYLQTK